jgi:hypothetical protein
LKSNPGGGYYMWWSGWPRWRKKPADVVTSCNIYYTIKLLEWEIKCYGIFWCGRILYQQMIYECEPKSNFKWIIIPNVPYECERLTKIK